MSMLRKWNAARIRPLPKVVRLRISIPAGVIVDTNTDKIAIMCRYGAGFGDEWYTLLTTTDGLVIEAKEETKR